MNVGLAGNIGQSLAYQVAECNYDYYVIELSSFQLDNMYKFHANIAVLMNITPDHLDRYDHQMQTMWMPNSALSRTRPRTMPSSSGTMTPSSSVNYTNMAFMAITTLCRKERGRNRRICGTGQGLFTEPIAFNMEQEELALTGTHNLFNSMAAGISANLAGIRKECIREALGDFKGVEHRLEKSAG